MASASIKGRDMCLSLWACMGHATAAAGACALCACPVVASTGEEPTWTEQKCALYETAVKEAITLQGMEGLRVEFLTENQTFIDGGCIEKVDICPMTDEEWKLADLLTKMTMNEGMASTFVPFGCP